MGKGECVDGSGWGRSVERESERGGKRWYDDDREGLWSSLYEMHLRRVNLARRKIPPWTADEDGL